jgi:thioredoxin
VTAVQTVDDQTFEQAVLAADEPVLVEFWASWCPPCHQLSPVLDAIAAERAGRLTIMKLNHDENPVTPSQYRVMGLPTMILFSAGEPVATVVGARSKAALLRTLDEALESIAA